MKEFQVPKSLRRRISKELMSQPSSFHDGDAYAGHVYCMSEADYRRRTRILRRLDDEYIFLSTRDLKHLRAVLYFCYRRRYPVQARGHYQYQETYYRPQPEAYWQRVERAFEEAGVKGHPHWGHAWER